VDEPDIQRQVLQALYVAYFPSRDQVNLVQLLTTQGQEVPYILRVLSRIEEAGLITTSTMGGNFCITPAGAVEAERQHLVPNELIQRNQQARIMVLTVLMQAYEEGLETPDGRVWFQELPERTGLDVNILITNLEVLKAGGYVEDSSDIFEKITPRGRAHVHEVQFGLELRREFDDISNMDPHPRGRAFNSFFGKLAARNRWSQESGVATSYEEMDVIMFKGRESYLVECKWEKHPIQPKVISGLYGKLHKRVGMQGVVVSMSGFTEGATRAVKDFTDDHLVLLFGPEDVRSMVFQSITVDELLGSKYKQLLSRGEVAFR
jgi:hypothetical protein